jgi:hypothetical protein
MHHISLAHVIDARCQSWSKNLRARGAVLDKDEKKLCPWTKMSMDRIGVHGQIFFVIRTGITFGDKSDSWLVVCQPIDVSKDVIRPDRVGTSKKTMLVFIICNRSPPRVTTGRRTFFPPKYIYHLTPYDAFGPAGDPDPCLQPSHYSVSRHQQNALRR